ncbi:hypothetical protein [Enterococcus avium]|jgi:hypothetical protein|nr:hypothetical protein [Enterococcus avium]
MTNKLPTVRVIKNTHEKLRRLEKQLSEIMSEKGFDGGFTYRADEYNLCYEWEYEQISMVSIVENQKELDYLLESSFDEAVKFLEDRSV